MTMFEIMEKALRSLKAADQAEIYAERGFLMQLDIERERVREAKKSNHHGIGIRVAMGKKIGFSYTTDLNKIGECAERAISQAKISRHDPCFNGFMGAKKYPEISRTFDERVLDLEPEKGFEYCDEMIAGAKDYDDRVKPTGGGFSAGYGEAYVLNSEGIEICDRGTYLSGVMTVSIRDEKVSAWESSTSRMLDDIDFKCIGEETARIATESINPCSIESRTLPAILAPRAMQELLSQTTVPQLSAENVQRNQSPYVQKMGKGVASENLTIIDDGTMPRGIGSTRMDGEGAPTQHTTLIENGILRTFLYDSYAAGKDGVESTGNAVRSYDELPRIGVTNFIIKPGRMSREALIAGIDKGLLITDVIGAHTAARASGEFSVTVHNGFLVARGEIHPVENVMISGNMPDILRKIDAVANDVREIGNVVTPSVLVSEIQVIGDS